MTYHQVIASRDRGRGPRALGDFEPRSVPTQDARNVLQPAASQRAPDRKSLRRDPEGRPDGKIDSEPGRRIDNTLTSEFDFGGGRIVRHRDCCDAMAWARQAFPFPKSLIAGSIASLRRWIAAKKLKEFTEKSRH